MSRRVLGSIQAPIQWEQEALSPGTKRPGREADHLPPASAEVKKNVDLYIHYLIRRHVVVRNSLSTETTLPYLPFTSVFQTEHGEMKGCE
jgi:hypothetical protein